MYVNCLCCFAQGILNRAYLCWWEILCLLATAAREESVTNTHLFWKAAMCDCVPPAHLAGLITNNTYSQTHAHSLSHTHKTNTKTFNINPTKKQSMHSKGKLIKYSGNNIIGLNHSIDGQSHLAFLLSDTILFHHSSPCIRTCPPLLHWPTGYLGDTSGLSYFIYIINHMLPQFSHRQFRLHL